MSGSHGTASLRRLLQALFPSDPALDAFCLDHFPSVHAEITQGMLRTQKLNLLLSMIPSDELLALLRVLHPTVVAASLQGRPLPVRGLAQSPSPVAAQAQRNRQRMLDKVRKFWIEGVLEKSLHRVGLLDLPKAYRPDAVAYPWDLILVRPDTAPQPVPQGKRMIDLFDENLGELLVLGAPGAGKTTMLLDLCRDLLTRAEQDVSHPIPVVFNLSSWAQKRPPLAEWLMEELHLRYDVPPATARAWQTTQQILPLLDGVDEVHTNARSACIEAITAYRSQATDLAMVITSRSTEYLEERKKLRLFTAVELQPLNTEQLSAIVNTATYDHELLDLIHNPMWLTVAMSALSKEEIMSMRTQQHNNSNTKKYLFDTFFLSSIRRRPTAKFGSTCQVLQYLRSIAKSMLSRSQTTFYLEDLDANFTPRFRDSRLLRIGCDSVFWLLFIGILRLLQNTYGGFVSIPAFLIWDNPLFMFGFSAFLALSADLYTNGGTIRPIDRISLSLTRSCKYFVHSCKRGLVVSIASVLALWAPTIAINFYLHLKQNIPIDTSVLFLDSRVDIFTNFKFIVLSVFYIFISSLSSYCLWFLFVSDSVPLRSSPNHGITLPIRVVSILVVLYFLLITAFYFSLNRLAYINRIVIQFLGILGPLISMAGSSAIFRHYCLRVFFALAGKLPLRLVPFLDFACACHLMRRVGGGYLFIHRLFLEHFAALSEDDIKRLAAQVPARAG